MLLHGSGNGFLTYQTWTSSNAYNANKVTGRMVAGDFNGDGKDDIASLYDYGSQKMSIHRLISTGTQFGGNTAYSSMISGTFDCSRITNCPKPQKIEEIVSLC